jgi:HD-like signal output (HDOD) protein
MSDGHRYSAEEFIEGVVQVASLPEIVTRLNEVIDDPYSDLSDIADIISSDTGLAARLLRIANSAMFNFPSRVSTISHAITIIGTKQLRDLVLATTVIRVFAGIESRLVNMESFWRHSIACGIVARVIAAYRHEPNIEGLYIMGLLHDIGRLVIYMKCPELADEMLRRSHEEGALLYEVERQTLGFDHGRVGCLLLKAWQLPEVLQEAVGCHHSPSEAARYPEDAATIHVADMIANALQMGSSGGHLVPPLVDEAWQQIGLSAGLIGTMVPQVERQYDDAVELFLN